MQSLDGSLKNCLILYVKQNEYWVITEVFVLKGYHNEIILPTLYLDEHPHKNKYRGLYVSKDLKASLLQNYHKITRLHLITKHPLTKNKPRKKLSKTTLDMKTQNHFVEKKGCTPLLAKNMFSCSANTSGEEVCKN